MSVYTRVTVAAAAGRCEVVVPSDESLGSALPRLLELLGETEGTVARPLALVTADGEQLDIARSPAQLELLDGTLLRLERLESAPPPPVVIDVTDAAADAHDTRGDRWDDRARLVAAGTGIAVATGIAALAAPYGTPLVAVWVQLAALVLLLALAAGLGLAGLRRVAGCVGAAAAGIALTLGVASAAAAAQSVGAQTVDAAVLVAATVAVAALSSVALVAAGIGGRSPGARAGGALGAVIATLLLVLVLAGVPVDAAAAIAGTVAAFATGPLPWIALSAAGLTTLDTRAAAGERVSRARATGAIDDAYAALTWSVATLAAVLAITGVTLALVGGVWPGLAALALALVAALRSRAFPLRAQVWSLWAAAAAIAAAGLVGVQGTYGGGVAVAVSLTAAVVVAAAAVVRPRPHVRARLRGVGNALETLALVALLPIVLGVMGVYEDLLGVFGGGA